MPERDLLLTDLGCSTEPSPIVETKDAPERGTLSSDCGHGQGHVRQRDDPDPTCEPQAAPGAADIDVVGSRP